MPESLKSAVVTVLRPLIGLLMEHGLTYPWLSGVLKSVFVDVAEKEFRLPDKRQTDSRVTLLTGVHRKDVRRLRRPESGMTEPKPPESVYLGAHLVAVWTSDERYLDLQGRPKPLTRQPRDNAPSFEKLVTSISKDIRPRAVLDELLRVNAVEIDEDDCVRLRTEAFIPSKGFDEKAYFLGRNVHDHIAAARHNVQGGEPPFLERSVYYDELSEESVRELDALARREGMRLLQTVNKRARELQAADRNAEQAMHRMNFGMYFYQAPEPSESQGED
ncbi:MAG TPA: DUF6502 family protein [Arenicellales bacterium]|nr:DUF6502 family protein [Arenicellales bacterium]